MRLTWRDGAATLLAGLVAAVVLAVIQGWAWPLLGNYRAGVVALTIVGFAMCTAGFRDRQPSAFGQPFMVVSTLLGIAAAVLIVLGLFMATEPLFVALGATILTMWLLSTVHHAVPDSHTAAQHRPA